MPLAHELMLAHLVCAPARIEDLEDPERATPAAPLTRTSMGGAPWRLVFSGRFRIIRRSRRESPRR